MTENWCIGVIEVYIHQARDIPSICIYHDQDVYAKISLSSDPETAVSTRVINGGGKNPVFNENLRLDVRTLDSCLKCEIWMLSRIRNYLEDQLLGFALVPLFDVVAGNGRVMAQEFSLSSCELVNSSAGSVQLSLTYAGFYPPDILETPMKALNLARKNSEPPTSVLVELGKIEFPDPETDKENEVMLSEYIQLPSTGLIPIPETPNGEDGVSCPKKTLEEAGEAQRGSSAVMSVKVEAEEKVVQQEIAEMYMKSMRQFTESLAKMKLPLGLEDGGDEKESRVFYGSRAFF